MALGNLRIIQKLLLGVLPLILISIGALGGYWIYQEYDQFQQESAHLRQLFIESRNQLVKNEVDKAVEFIRFNQARLDARLRDELKSRVDEAVQIVESIYLTNIAEMSEEQIKHICRETLRRIRFWNNRGYYFAANTNGIIELNANQPGIEGRDQNLEGDSPTSRITKEMIALALGKGAGYLEYRWVKPGKEGDDFRKLSYVRLFKPLNWVIGLGEYQDDWTQAAQKEILDVLQEVIANRQDYLFAGTYQGLSLLGPAKGRNMLKEADSRSQKVVRDLIAAARQGGGFVQYMMPALNGHRPSMKVSYCLGVPGWDWYVGAGYYLDDLEKGITERQELLHKQVVHKLINIAVLTFCTCCVAVILLLVFSRSLSRELQIFRAFFQNAASDTKSIDASALRSHELRSLAQSANRMVAERNRINQEKNKMEQQLRQSQKMEAIGSLAGGIAHDFNNILTAITGYSELAQVQQHQGKNVTYELEQVLAACERARELVRRILTFSRKGSPELRTLDLNQQIVLAARMLERTIPRMIKVEMDLAPNLWAVQGDSTQLEQVLMNLGTNAADAMPDGGRLFIKTDTLEVAPDQEEDIAAGLYVRLLVSDTGRGMDPETVNKAFDPFFTTKPTGKGTGLGLSTVYGIVASHGGKITLHSQIGQGTAVTILIPATRLTAQAEVPETVAHGSLGQGHETVLLVDDDPSVREVAGQFLARKGYRVLSASSGEAALRIYQEKGQEIDLVILDLSMPGMGGRACLRQLMYRNPSVRVLIAGGYSPEGEIGDTLDLGAKSYITKPFSQSELLSKVREVLDQ